MITHEEAREIVDKIYVHTDWETKDKLLAYISQQEQLQAEHEALKRDVQKLMYYLEYKEKWTNELTESLNFYYYKVLNRVGKEE